MKTISFNSFIVDDSNRQAFEACRDVALFKPVSPMPALLVGEPGSGKTHLLYSVVNQLRASSAQSKYAYITATDFDDRARALIDDPGPVQRARNAVLLVDQLERFGDLAPELEQLVRIFLDNKHFAVLASSVHIERLTNLPESLRALLSNGQIIPLPPQDPQTRIERIRQEALGEAQEKLATKDGEIAELRDRLSQIQSQGTQSTSEVLDLHGRLENEQAALAQLEEQYSAAQIESEGYRRRIEELEQELAQQGEDREHAARQAAQKQEKIAELEAEIADIEVRLEEARRESDAARREANQLVQRAESLLQQIESNRQHYQELDAQRQREIKELEKRLGEQGEEAMRAARKEFQTEVQLLRQQVEEVEDQRDAAIAERADTSDTLAAITKERDAARAETESVRKERDELRREMASFNERLRQYEAKIEAAKGALDEARATREQLQQQLSGAHRNNATLMQEFEQYKKEAAKQVAEANAQTGEFEKGLNAAHKMLGRRSRMNISVAEDLETLRRAMADIAELMGTLTRRVAVSDDSLPTEKTDERAALNNLLATLQKAVHDGRPAHAAAGPRTEISLDDTEAKDAPGSTNVEDTEDQSLETVDRGGEDAAAEAIAEEVKSK